MAEVKPIIIYGEDLEEIRVNDHVAVATDSSIQGVGSTPDPFRLYGIVNSCVEQDLTVEDGYTMINRQIDIKVGFSIDILSGGQLHLLP